MNSLFLLVEMKGVIGVGNTFKKDDGIGVKLVRKLRGRETSSETRIFDVGLDVIKVLHILKDLDKAIIVDAVRYGGEPGDFVFFSPEEVNSLKGMGSSHESDLLDILELSRELGESPEEVVIMGIEPEDDSHGEEITPTLKERFPELLDKLFEKLESL